MATSSSFANRFPEARFRDAIINTFLMAMPEAEEDRLTWYWKRTRVYEHQDPATNPYSWDATPTTDAPGNPDLTDEGGDQSLVVPYAMEFSSRPAGSDDTTLGEIDNSRIVVTMLDSDYMKVAGGNTPADYVMVDGVRYRIQFRSPPMALFGVGVHQVFLEAEDET